MHYCRHCQKPTRTDSGPCPHCGKELSNSIPLETQDESTQDAVPGMRHVDPATGEITESGPGTADVDLDPGDSDSIELGFDPNEERRARAQEPAPSSASGAEAGPPGGQSASPTSADTSSPGEDEVASVAGYGSPPDSFFKTAGYMFHVRKRRRALAREVASIDTDVANALDDLDADLLKVGTRKEQEAVEEGDFGRQVEAIHEMKAQVDQFRQQRDVEDKDRESKIGYIDEEISRLEVEVQKFRNEEEIVAREAEDAYASRKRVQLKLQRVEIEIRNIKQTMPTSKKGEPPIDPKELEPFEKQIAEREETHKTIKSELQEADDVVKEVNRKLAIARNAVSEQMGKVSLANKKKEAILENARNSEQQSQKQFFDLQKKLEDRYRDLARESLKAEKLPRGMENMADVIARKMDVVQGLKAKLELHRTALDSYSHSDYTKGHILLGGVGGLVLVLIILVLIIAL